MAVPRNPRQRGAYLCGLNPKFCRERYTFPSARATPVHMIGNGRVTIHVHSCTGDLILAGPQPDHTEGHQASQTS